MLLHGSAFSLRFLGLRGDAGHLGLVGVGIEPLIAFSGVFEASTGLCLAEVVDASVHEFLRHGTEVRTEVPAVTSYSQDMSATLVIVAESLQLARHESNS